MQIFRAFAFVFRWSKCKQATKKCVCCDLKIVNCTVFSRERLKCCALNCKLVFGFGNRKLFGVNVADVNSGQRRNDEVKKELKSENSVCWMLIMMLMRLFTFDPRVILRWLAPSVVEMHCELLAVMCDPFYICHRFGFFQRLLLSTVCAHCLSQWCCRCAATHSLHSRSLSLTPCSCTMCHKVGKYL